jgi:hypothetical protein
MPTPQVQEMFAVIASDIGVEFEGRIVSEALLDEFRSGLLRLLDELFPLDACG